MAWSRRTDWAAVALAQGWVQGSLLDVAYRLRRNWHPEFGGWELDIVGLQGAGTMENGGTRE
jgi:single-stranded-DNA-specific exonuclease